MSVSILDIPIDVIKVHIIPHLYGKDVRCFLMSHPRHYGMYDSVDRLVLEFGQRNIYRASPTKPLPHDKSRKEQDCIPCIYCPRHIHEHKYENHLSRCLENPNIQGKKRCKCVIDDKNRGSHWCLLSTVTCKICDTVGCKGDIMPWRQASYCPNIACLECGKSSIGMVGCTQCRQFHCPVKVSKCCDKNISCIPNHKCCNYCKQDITGIVDHQCERSLPRWLQMISTTNNNMFINVKFYGHRIIISKPFRYWQISAQLQSMMYNVVWIPINRVAAQDDNGINIIIATQHPNNVVFIVKGEATSIADTSCILYYNLGCLATPESKGWNKF